MSRRFPLITCWWFFMAGWWFSFALHDADWVSGALAAGFLAVGIAQWSQRPKETPQPKAEQPKPKATWSGPPVTLAAQRSIDRMTANQTTVDDVVVVYRWLYGRDPDPDAVLEDVAQELHVALDAHSHLPEETDP